MDADAVLIFFSEKYFYRFDNLNWSWILLIYFLLFKGLNGLILKQRTKILKRNFSVMFSGYFKNKDKKKKIFWVKMICREEWKQKDFCASLFLSSSLPLKCLEFIRHWNPKTLNYQRSLQVTENSNRYRFFLSNAEIQSTIELKHKTTQLNTDRNSIIPIEIMDFRLKIHYSYFHFLTFNYKKVPVKTKTLQLNP